MFIHTHQPWITSFYIKNYQFFAELAISQRWSAIISATGALGLKYGARLIPNFLCP